MGLFSAGLLDSGDDSVSIRFILLWKKTKKKKQILRLVADSFRGSWLILLLLAAREEEQEGCRLTVFYTGFIAEKSEHMSIVLYIYDRFTSYLVSCLWRVVAHKRAYQQCPSINRVNLYIFCIGLLALADLICCCSSCLV